MAESYNAAEKMRLTRRSQFEFSDQINYEYGSILGAPWTAKSAGRTSGAAEKAEAARNERLHCTKFVQCANRCIPATPSASAETAGTNARPRCGIFAKVELRAAPPRISC
jgi:hypothetical protein